MPIIRRRETSSQRHQEFEPAASLMTPWRRKRPALRCNLPGRSSPSLYVAVGINGHHRDDPAFGEEDMIERLSASKSICSHWQGMNSRSAMSSLRWRVGTASKSRLRGEYEFIPCQHLRIPLVADGTNKLSSKGPGASRCSPRCAPGRHNAPRSQFALIEIALFILGTPTDLKEMLPDTSSQQAEPAPSFHQY